MNSPSAVSSPNAKSTQVRHACLVAWQKCATAGPPINEAAHALTALVVGSL